MFYGSSILGSGNPMEENRQQSHIDSQATDHLEASHRHKHHQHHIDSSQNQRDSQVLGATQETPQGFGLLES